MQQASNRQIVDRYNVAKKNTYVNMVNTSKIKLIEILNKIDEALKECNHIYQSCTHVDKIIVDLDNQIKGCKDRII